MSDQELETANTAVASEQAVNVADSAAADVQANESVPDFQTLNPNQAAAPAGLELNRFGGVQVVLTAELGRTKVTIQELMGLAEGAVLELNRAISAPVELVAQGVPLGNGEVVVIDDQFAIRIKEIYLV